MKAEQRKELETNVLADKMGQVVKRVKTGARRTFFIYFAIGAVVIGGGIFGLRYWENKKDAASVRWLMEYDGARYNLLDLVEKDPNSDPGKAARFQVAWFLFWDTGFKTLASEQRGSLVNIAQSGKIYAELAKDCKDDPVLKPQALLGQAVVEETLALEDRAHLDVAKELYEEIVKDHEKSAEAKFAQDRLDEMKNEASMRTMKMKYTDLQQLLLIPARAAENPRTLQPAPKGKKE
jgi:hypothetical protein